jgi:hypothetical protein
MHFQIDAQIPESLISLLPAVQAWVPSQRTVNIIQGQQECSLLHVVQTASGAHPASNPMGTGAVTSGVMQPWREADHSPTTSAEVKKTWIYTSTSPYAFMA